MTERRSGRGWAAVAVIAVLVILAAVAPSPFAVERPGPVVDALGSIDTPDGEIEVVRITGEETFGTEGSLNVLSVSISGTPERPSSWLSLAGALIDPARGIVPLSDIYPAGIDEDARRMQGEALMRGSQASATAAALRELGEPVRGTVRITAVVADGPAGGVLRGGDAVLSIDGAEVSTVAELRAAVAASGAGRPVSLGIDRDGEKLAVSVVPVADAPGAPVIGVLAGTEFEFPFDVALELDEIGGPSAGLIFALAVYDVLTPGGLTGGLEVSGTGTIDEAGGVGAIGGLPQKLWGASRSGTDLMLMPIANCADLPRSLPDGMRIAPVETLGEAIAAIETAAGGGEPPGLERCDPAADAAGGDPRR